MLAKFKNCWNQNEYNFKWLLILSAISIVWVVILFFVEGLITGLGSMILLAVLLVLSAITFSEKKYYYFLGLIFVIFLYDLFLLVNNTISLGVTIGLIGIYLVLMIYATTILVLRITEVTHGSIFESIILPLNFIVVGFYTIVCADMTDIYWSSTEFRYEVQYAFPVVMFGLFFLQLFFMFLSRGSLMKKKKKPVEQPSE